MIGAIGERESAGQVLELTVPVQGLTNIQTKRIGTEDCLDDIFVVEQITPNKITEITADGSKWMVIVPYGGYSPKEHLMAMRLEPGYKPTPESLSAEEGDELFATLGKVAKRMEGDPSAPIIVFGWNWSPRSFGQRGHQSIPTRYHPSVFNLPDGIKKHDEYMRHVALGSLKTEERRAVQGGAYNKPFADLLSERVLNGRFTGDRDLRETVLDTQEPQLGRRGLIVPLKGSISATLTTPGIFGQFFKPMSEVINQTAVELSQALTDFQPEEADRMIATAFSEQASAEDRKTAFANLTHTPSSLPLAQIRENIDQLEQAGYPASMIDYLKRLSRRFPENGGPFTNWKVGFGCAVTLVYDTRSKEGILSVSSAIADGPGGIVEAGLGVVLRRPAYPFSPEEMAIKKQRYLELVDGLE